MKEKEMSKAEIREFILWYLTDKTTKKSLKDHRQMENFIKEELDITEELVREDVIPNDYPFYREQMLVELFKNGRCTDLALAAAKEMTDQFNFRKKEFQMEVCGYEWKPADEERMVDWLLCRCDTPPEVIPERVDLNYFITHDHDEVFFAAMSEVCDFPVRYCAYALYGRFIYLFKFPFRSLILFREEGYADAAVEQIKKIYIEDLGLDADRADSDIKTEFAAIYCGGNKKKAETAFYKKYIDKWMEEDSEGFLGLFRGGKPNDVHKKVLKKLTGSTK